MTGPPGFEGISAAARLRTQRATISAQLAKLVAAWPKYADQYRADPAAFAQLETDTLVDYIALLLETGDENFRHLYVGEKAKQFYDPNVDKVSRHQREAALLAGERMAFAGALGGEAVELTNATFDAIDHALTAEAASEIRALFVGDCLFLDLIGFLTAPALADGVRIKPSFITSHDAAAIKQKIAALADERFDVIFYSPFTYALLSDYEALQRPRVIANPKAAHALIGAAVAAGLDIFDTLADLFDCPIVAHAPAPILRQEQGLKARIGAALTLPFRRAATRRLEAALRIRAATRNASGHVIYIIDEMDIARRAGGLADAGRYLFRSNLQHPAAFGAMLAPLYRDIVMVVGRLRKRKLIACDLDNTLWEGVIGEGLGVAHHYDRQASLLTLKERGVVLAINSKNDPARVVWGAQEGRLGLDHFVSRQINWDPKTINIRRIAEHLNLKEKDFVFVDDRADERAMVEEQFPTLLALDALDLRSWRLLELWGEFLPAKPGADRSEFYRQRDARQAFIAAEADISADERAATFQELGLGLTIREAEAGDIDRVADLINRTNQFNTTGGRISRRQVEGLMARDDAWVLIAEASDRFGPMGTISILIAERGAGRLSITYFVLSCRVFGYGMEYAILETARGFTGPNEPLYGALVKTEFNQPCQDVYSEAGFAKGGEGWIYSGHNRSIAVPSWLKIDTRARTAQLS